MSMAPMTLHKCASLHVYGHKNRCLRLTNVHEPVHLKKKRVQICTASERKAVTLRQRDHKQRVQDAIDDALWTVWTEAEKLHELLGIHSPKKFYKILLQRGGKGMRKISRWNIWLHKEKQEKLAGK